MSARLVVRATARRGGIGMSSVEYSAFNARVGVGRKRGGPVSAAGPKRGCSPSGGSAAAALATSAASVGVHSIGAFLALKGLEAFPHRCRWRGTPDSARRRQFGGRFAYALIAQAGGRPR